VVADDSIGFLMWLLVVGCWLLVVCFKMQSIAINFLYYFSKKRIYKEYINQYIQELHDS